MRRPRIHELIRLPEKQAVKQYLDGDNFNVLKQMLLAWGTVFSIGTVVLLSEGHYVQAGIWGVAMLATLAVYAARGTHFLQDNLRPILGIYLVVLLLVFARTLEEAGAVYSFAGFLFPSLLLAFRLRWYEYVALLSIFYATTSWVVVTSELAPQTATRVGMLIAALAWACAVFGLSQRFTRRRVERFVRDWRSELLREKEQSRMRDELNSAREMQLSMLPRHDPDMDWLDFSGVSLPASEVGGDYFEHFKVNDSVLAVVIGDVAGHGMASGLVLSGVRSGLYLLRENLTAPVEVLERLNRLVRETAPRRMFVTLQIAVLNAETRMLTVANAGHPPLVRLDASTGKAEVLGSSGLPLGTQLEPEFTVVEKPMEPGDVLVFHTDGVLEVSDLHEESFGEDRLRREVARTGRRSSARQIRDSILNEISRFKGDVSQADDLTLVVARFMP